MARASGALAVAVAATLVPAASAPAKIPDSLTSSCELRDAADDDTSNGRELPFHFCDDGVPNAGGRDPNPGADKAVAVPQRYAGFKGLPDKVTADPNSGADSNGRIALDVDLSFPDPDEHPMPTGGYPLVAMMHGCCAGNKTSWEADTIDAPDSDEQWHYSNAWFASRGYVVLTYTARGFVNGSGNGSTGETQIDDRRYEINDFQHLAGQIADDEFEIDGEDVGIDPRKVVTTGGSYGGGFSWLALTDPTWRSAGDERRLRLAASAPKYGWTDLVYSLVPNGTHGPDELPPTDGSGSVEPLGFPKQSIVAALYASGTTGVPPGTNHATFPQSIDDAFACTQSTDPFEQNPLCATTLETTLPSFIAHRSAYYQSQYFGRLADGASAARVPLFSAGTFTDNLFTSIEHRRMVDRMLRIDGDYPVQEYYGDYQHFTQNKRKEWSDLCAGGDVCELDDYPGGDLDDAPDGFSRLGVNTRLNRFLDHHVRPPANEEEPEPDQDVTASLQVCPENATEKFPADEPGKRFTASTFDGLARRTLRLEMDGDETTTNKALPNLHAVKADPVANLASNGGSCPVETTPAGPGVATYTSKGLDRRYTMIGQTRVSVPHTGNGNGVQLNARMYDVFPNGDQVMVDRGVRRVEDPDETTVFHLQGNGWRFPEGHKVRIELAQDDGPYIKPANQPSSLTLSGVTLRIPVREASPDDGPGDPGGGGPGGGGGGPGGGGGSSGGAGESGGGGATSASLGDLDCADFDSRADAQAALDRRPSDPLNLDADDDGVACEALSPAGNADSRGRLPLTGLALGLLALAGAMLAGGGAALRRRARTVGASDRPQGEAGP